MPKLLKKRLALVKKRHRPPEKHVSVFKGVIYGIGCGFGASIFVLVGEGFVLAENWVFLSLFLATIIIFLSALNYSELMTSLHVAGGMYNIGKEGVGGTFAFLNGFFLWISNITVSTFSANILNQTIITLFPFLKDYNFILIIVIFSTIGLLSFYANRFSTNLLIALTILLLFFFSIFITILFISTPPNFFIIIQSTMTNYPPVNIWGIIQTFALFLILFKGIMLNLAQINLDLENISRNIPRVNIISVILSSAIYFFIFLSLFFTINNFTEESILSTDNLMADVLSLSIGGVGALLMNFALILSTIITINASLSSATGIFKALVRDGYFSRMLFMRDEFTNEFSRNIIFLNIIVGILFITFIPFTGFKDEIIIFIYFFSLAFINFAAVILRHRRKELDRPFKAPFFPFLPLLIGGLCLILAFVLSLEAIIIGVMIGVIGVLIYLLIIADRHSKIITLTGIKFVNLIVIAISILAIKNFGILSSSIPLADMIFADIFLRILIFFCIFSIISIFFDIFTVREVINFFTNRIKKDTVAIKIGDGRIVEMNRKGRFATYIVKYLLGLFEILGAFFIYGLVYILIMDIIIIEQIDFGWLILDAIAVKYLLNSFLIIFGTTFLLRGISRIYYNWETILMNI